MANAKPFITNPVPLGLLSGTAGTPKRLTSNFTDLAGELFKELRFKNLAANTGDIFILSNSTAADTTNFTNVVLIIAKGEDKAIPLTDIMGNQLIASTFFVDWATTGDKLVVSGLQV